MSTNSKKLIVIVGPTASGKSGLAVRIAKKFDGEIISADSRQVYRGLDIGSGKVTKKEMRGVPHHLLDVASPKRVFTVAQYQRLARKAIQDIWKRGKLPIICGGTGFYVQAVVDGLIFPHVKPNTTLRKKLEKKSAKELFHVLEKKDPDRAGAIDRHNKRRLIRALEVIDALGKVPSKKLRPVDAKVTFIGIKKNETTLKKRIAKRLAKRIKEGMIEEVKYLHKTGLSWKRLESFGLEYRYVALHLQKKITKEDLIETLKKEIWRYAKRQRLWFKRDKRIVWV